MNTQHIDTAMANLRDTPSLRRYPSVFAHLPIQHFWNVFIVGF